MATIGKLVVSLQANSAKLVSELGKSRKMLKKWSSDAVKNIKSIGKVFSAVAAVAVGGFIIAVNKSAAEIDKITKAAGKLNFNIEEYQKLSFIAAKSNVEVEGFGKSMQRMLKTVGDARAGLTTATDAFDALGLSADHLAQLSPSEQFALIAERMALIPTQADKVKIAMDIFGRSGADLLNVFQGDIKGIGDEFDSLGVAITETQAAAVARFQDAKTSLGTLFSGFSRNVTAEVAPAFALIIEKITTAIKEMGGIKVAAQEFAKFVIKGIIGAVSGFGSFLSAIDELRLGMNTLQAVWLKTIAVLNLKPFAKASFEEQLKPVEAEIDKLLDKRLKIQLDIANRGKIEGYLNDLQKDLTDVITSGGGGSAGLSSGAIVKGKDGVIDYVASAKARITEESKLTQQVQATTQSLTELSSSAKAVAQGNVSAQFKQYAEMYKRDKVSGSGFAQDKLDVLNNLLKSSINNGALPQDVQAMQNMIAELQASKDGVIQTAAAAQQTASTNTAISGSASAIAINTSTANDLMRRALEIANKPLEKVGEITLNVVAANGGGKFNLQGDPEVLRQLKDMVETLTNNSARQYVN